MRTSRFISPFTGGLIDDAIRVVRYQETTDTWANVGGSSVTSSLPFAISGDGFTLVSRDENQDNEDKFYFFFKCSCTFSITTDLTNSRWVQYFPYNNDDVVPISRTAGPLALSHDGNVLLIGQRNASLDDDNDPNPLILQMYLRDGDGQVYNLFPDPNKQPTIQEGQEFSAAMTLSGQA